MTTDTLLWVLTGLAALAVLLLIVLLVRSFSMGRYAEIAADQVSDAVLAREERLRETVRALEQRQVATLTQYFHHMGEAQKSGLVAVNGMTDAVRATLAQLEARFRELSDLQGAQSRQMEGRLSEALEKITLGNEAKLEKIRETVAEKLDRTLSERLTESFRTVDDKLGLVQKGLGEMRQMAQSVRDLQGVLTNVKTRGNFGEVQLARLLSDLLAPEQFASQVRLDPASREAVDFAVKLPGRVEGEPCWLPIDAKFPMEDFERLLAAREASDRAAEEAAQKALAKAVLAQAKSIREKYVRPPVTTEFAVLFLPSESLYAEVLRTDGMFERLQKDYRITPAGPTVLAALLNSLQMGFVTLAIEARSAEIWRLLGDVKAEFGLFCEQFEHVSKKFDEAQASLKKMRTRQNVMARKMTEIDRPEDDASGWIGVSQEKTGEEKS